MPGRHRRGHLPREHHGEQRGQRPDLASQPRPSLAAGVPSGQRQALVRPEAAEEQQQRAVAGGHERRRAGVPRGRGSVGGHGGREG